MSSVLVSVITPTCNRPNTLRGALDSLCEQTYKNFEVVIGDDNPILSENSKMVESFIAEYVNRGLSIVYFKTLGKIGAGKVRNIAAQKANGSYLVFLDDDDEFFPNKIEDQLFFTLKSSADLSFHDATWFDDKDRLVEYRRLCYSKDETQEDLLKKHILYSICPGTTYMINKEAFMRTSGWGEVKSGQDWYLMLSCINEGLVIRYFPGMYVKQRLYANDRISLGANKIEGEDALYSEKKHFFKNLSFFERRYVVFRHYAVLAFASKRSGMRVHALKYAFMAILSSPVHCLIETKNYFSKEGSIGSV